MNKNINSLSAIVPIYNEEKTIKVILDKLKILKDYVKLEVIVINDGSTDNSKNIILSNSNLYDKFINLEKNVGKGKAVIEGIKSSNSEFIFIQDADLEYFPEDLIKFINKINELNLELVIGSRFTSSNSSIFNFWHKLGNKFITFFFNILNNTAFTDIYCCYLMFKKKNLNIDYLKSLGWGQQAEMLTFLVKNSKKTFEISVNYNGRSLEDGKKIRYFNIFEVIFWILISVFRSKFLYKDEL